MSIVQTTEGWSFTLGQQTYTGYPTKEQAAEAQYDIERGIDRQQQPGDLVDAVLAYVSAAEEEIIETAARAAAQRQIEDRVIRLAVEILAERAAAQPVAREHGDEDGFSWRTWRHGETSLDLMPNGRGTLVLFNTTHDIDGAAERAELLALRTLLNTPDLVAALEADYPVE